MNKRYRLIWNASTQTWVAAAETARGRGKRSSVCAVLASASAAGIALLMVLPPFAAAAPPPAPGQLPTGGQVVAGQAAISQSANTLTIDQGSNRAAIDWQTFNVGSAAQVRFKQPDSRSVTLNRVTDANPSQIFGKISANGQVFLSNPNGVYFSPGASVDVGGLVATTHQISLGDFMAGTTRFERNGATGAVINEGELRSALGGYIALLAPEVRNSGLILATLGTVALAAGERFELQFDANNTLASLQVSPSTIAALVDNRAAVLAPGGLIILSAQALDRVQGGVVKNSGRLEAIGLSRRNGRIVLEASSSIANSGSISANAGADLDSAVGGPAGSISLSAPAVTNSGLIEAKGNADYPQGGSVRIQADTVFQSASAALDVSGPGSGGTIRLNARQHVELGGRMDASATADTRASADPTAAASQADAPASASQGGSIEVLAASIGLSDAALDASGARGGRVLLDASASAPASPSPVPAPPPDAPPREPGQLALLGTTRISVRGRRSEGGSATLLGEHIALNDATALDARGATAGGTVLVGGDWQGSNGVYQATTVQMAEGSSIDANATAGTGGMVVLWSDVHNANSFTEVAGRITVGNGAVETSGHLLGIRSTADVQARGGQWLIDPADVTISTAADSNQTSFAPNSGTSTANVNTTTLVNALNTGADVTVTTTNSGSAGAGSGNLTVSNTITTTGTTAGALSLMADKDITINANVTLTGTNKALLFKAVGNITQAASTTVQTNGGNITYNSRSTDVLEGGGILIGGNANIDSRTEADRAANTDTTGGGAIVLAGGSDISTGYAQNYNVGSNATGITGIYMGGSNSVRSGGGNITARGKVTRALNTYQAGYLTQFGVTMNAGISGNIAITGNASGAANTMIGLWSNINDSTPDLYKTINGNITLVGTGQDASGSQGVALTKATVEAVGTGSISITGTASTNTYYGLNPSNANILAASGAITLIDASTFGAGGNLLNLGGTTIGAKAGSDVTSSTSNVLIQSDVISVLAASSFNTTGALTLQSNGASFAQALTYPLTNLTLAGTVSGLTIGRTTNTADVTLGVATTVAGPISIYGGNINVNANLVSTASTAPILLKATGNITQAASTTVQTNGGAITYNSRSTDAVDGGILVNTSGVIDSRTAADRAASTDTTGGGNILLSGSSNASTGYAQNYSSQIFGIQLGTGTSLRSGGGNVGLRGKITRVTNTYNMGINTSGLAINSGNAGNIALDGVASVPSGANVWGMALVSPTFRTANGNITLNGQANGASGANLGIDISASGLITATGTGSISMIGNGLGGSQATGVSVSTSKVLAASGAISLIDTSTYGAGATLMNLNGSSIGAFAGSAVTTSSSPVLIQGDAINAVSSASTVNTSGTLTLQSNAASFAQALTYPITNLTVAGTVSGLTIGRTTNTADVTVGSATSIAGPITIYGGNINVNANLLSTASTAPILLKASGNILQAASTTVQTNGGAITYNSRSTDQVEGGGIQIGNSAVVDSRTATDRSNNTDTTGGGNILLSGGSDPTTGFAQNNANTGIYLGNSTTVRSGSGNITARGQVTRNSGGAYNYGIAIGGQTTMNAGTNGNIAMTGQATGGPTNGMVGIGANINALSSDLYKTVNGNIRFTGNGSGATNNFGVLLNANVTVEAVGSGAISMTANAGTSASGYYGLAATNAKILAASGAINLVDTTTAGGTGYLLRFINSSIGSAAGSDVTSSSSNILLQGDSVNQSAPSNAINTSGTFTLQSNGASFAQAMNDPLGLMPLASTVSGLTLGRTTNTADITLTSAVNIAGPISVYGANINANGNLTTTASTAPILLKATGNITQAASTTVKTNGGAITYNSRSTDQVEGGGIQIGANDVIDSRTAADRTANTDTTGGGAILLSGGSNAATGFAQNQSNFGVSFEVGATVRSGSGNITARGQVTRESGTGNNYGVQVKDGVSMNAGTSGDITITGIASGSSANGMGGVWVNPGNYAPALLKTTNGNIALTGTASGATFNYGVVIVTSTLEAVGSGSINLTGYAGTSALGYFGMNGYNSNILAASGAINLVDTSTFSEVATQLSFTQCTIGALGGSAVTSSSSNVLLQGDSVDQAANSGAINTSGTLVLLSNGSSFAQALLDPLGALGVASTVSGLTIGRSTNTADITLSTAKTLAGPITVYGGNINVNDSLATSAAGDILTRASGTLTLASAKTVSTSNGNITLTAARFVNNNTSVAALSAGGSGKVWQVWSSNASPFGGATPDVRSNLAFDYKQYGATYGVTTPASGKGLLYSYQPTLSAVLTGTTSKAYDGALSVTGGTIALSTATGALDGDSNGSLSTSGTYVFATAGAGSNKQVNISGAATATVTNGGKPVFGYAVVTGANTLGTISPKLLAVSGLAATSKTYDGSTAATGLISNWGAVLTGVGSEVLTLNHGSATFDTKNVGLGKTVTGSGYSLADGSGGGLAANYALTSTSFTTTADITPKALTLSGITANDKVYDGNRSASISLTGVDLVAGGMVTGDGLSLSSSGVFDNKNVGTGKTVTLTNSLVGINLSNYTVSDQASALAAITQAGLTVTAPTVTKTYDTSVAATGTASVGTLAGAGAGDVVNTAATLAFTDKNAGFGNKTVRASGLTIKDGSNADVTGNYAITYTDNTSSTINTKVVNISGSRVYDRSTGVAAVSLNVGATAGGETLGLTGTGSVADKNVGTAKVLILDTLALVNGSGLASNYTLAGGVDTVNITPAGLTVSGITAANKTYDGNTIASINSAGAVLSGLFSGDTVTVASSSGTFADKNVGTGKTVALVNTFGGAQLGNYSITDQTSAAADITAKVLNLSGSKVYNATANVAATSLAVSGLVGTETLSLLGIGSTTDKNVANGKALTLDSLALGNGSNGGLASNYTLAGGVDTVNITPAGLTVSGITAANKTYDGNTTATVSSTGAALSGLFSGDTVTVASSSGTFADKNVGAGKTVTLVNTFGGAQAGNYTITDQTSTSANITAKVLNLSGSKVYDATANVAATSLAVSGLVGSETLSLSGIGSTTDKNVANGKALTLDSLALANGSNGGLASNYTLAGGVDTVNITQAGLTVSGITAANKTYDGNTAASVNSAGATLSGLIIGDKVTVASSSGTFADKNVGTGKTVTLVNTFGGAQAGNYSITDQTSTTADITAKVLNLSGSKVYDATTDVTAGSLAVSGLVGSETLSLSGIGSTADKNVANGKALTLGGLALADGSNGGLASNYTLAGGSHTVNITPAAITVGGITVANKTYDGNTTASVNSAGATLSGLIIGDTVTLTSSSGTFADKNVGTGKTVTLVNTFGGAQSGNYSITDQASTSADITAKVLNLSGSKVYDAGVTVAAGSLAVSGLIGTETLSLSGAGTTADKNVANGKTLTLDSLALANGSNGGLASNYTLAGGSDTVNITPAGLSVSGITAANKTYNGNTAASINSAGATLSGLFSGDTVTVASSSGTFADKNVGTGKTITLVNTFGGAQAGNYSITNQTSATADITAKVLNLSGSKVYDATTDVAAGSLAASGLVGSETLSLSGIGTTTDKNVANGKALTLVGLALGNGSNGGLASNYTLAGGSDTVNITQAAIAVSGITASNKTYDGNTTASINSAGATLSGLFSGDTVTVASSSGTFADKNVGTGKTVTLVNTFGGAQAGNYSITDQASTSANITAKVLNLSGSKVYDATANVAATSLAVSGLVGSETLSLSGIGSTTDKNVANGKALTLDSLALANGSNGGLASNYTLAGGSDTVNITPAGLTVSGITAANKTYDGNTIASINSAGAALSGLFSGDTVTVASSSGSFSDKNVGTGKTVTLVNTFGGAQAGNYSITDQTSAAADITAKVLNLSGSKVYDATANVAADSLAVSGLVGSETLSLSGIGTTTDKNVANGKALTLGGLALGNGSNGGLASNYTLAGGVDTVNITPAGLTVSGITAANKTYDGNTTATVSSTGAALSGLFSGDTVTVASSSGTFADKNVGTGMTVTLVNTFGGAQAGNYSITDQASTTADITAKVLNLSGSKVYDKGVNVAAGNLTLGGLIGTETLSLSGSGTTADKNVANGKALTLDSLALANGSNGGLASNYTLAGGVDTVNITPAAITVGGITAANKTYDGNSAASVNSAGATLAGLIGGDTVSVASSSGTFSDKNAGTAKTVTLANTFGGADAANYSITDQTSTSANITAKVLNLSGSKVYDATANVAAGSLAVSGLIGTETLSLSGSGSTADKNVANGKTLTLDSLALANGSNGGLASNYTLAGGSDTVNITQAAITVSGITAANKSYDGTNSASISSASAVLSGRISGDTVTLASSGTFSDKNAGTAKTVTLANTFGGADAANYSITDQTSTLASITAKVLTVTGLVAAAKTYDGTTSVSFNNWGDVATGVGSEVLVLNHGTAHFDTANVGSGKSVTATGYSLADGGSGASAALASNYTLGSTSATTTADITQAALLVRANNDAKFVTTPDTAGYNGVSFTGFVNAETSAALGGSATLKRSNAGTHTAGTYSGVLVPAGLTSANYAITFVPGDYTITPSGQLLVKVNSASTAYGTQASFSIASAQYFDGATVVDLGNITANGNNNFTVNDGAGGTATFNVIPTAGVASSSGKLAVGSYQLGLSGVSTQNNVNFSNTINLVGSQSVTAKGVTANATAGVSKVYDGNTTMFGVSINLTGQLANDVLTVSGNGAFTQKNVGTNLGYTVNNLALAGTDSGNYFLTGGTSFAGSNATIAAKSVNITGSKVYDARLSVAAGSLAVSGLVGTETLGLSGSGSTADKNVGTARALSLGTLALADGSNGGLASNYTLAGGSDTVNVTQAAITVGGITAANKSYDGSNSASINSAGATLAGLIGGDTVTLASSGGSFSDKNAGTAKTVTLANTFGGADAGNYAITDQASALANITAKVLNLSGSKVYDAGVSVAAGSLALGGLIGTETLSLSGSGSTADKNVANGKALALDTLALANGSNGGLASNYTLAGGSDTLNITRAGIAVSGITAASKSYDGNAAASVNSAAATLGGLIGGDTVTVASSSGTFSDKNAGAAKTVTLSTTYGGADAGNYSITDQASTTASITAKVLNLTGAKVYDAGVNVAAGSLALSGLIGTETLSLNGIGTTADKNVANGKTLSLGGLALGNGSNGGLASNYTLAGGSDTVNITRAALTVTGITAASKSYDGNAAAGVNSASAALGGLLGGDMVTVASSSGSFSDKNVGTAKTVTLTNTFGGADAGNYTIADQTSTTANITAKVLHLSGSKVYDAGVNVAASSLTLGGLIGTETLSLGGSGSTADKYVGAAKTLTLGSLALANGSNGGLAGNYTLSGGSDTVNITRAALTVGGITAASKTYDGSTSASINSAGASLSGLIGGDTVTVASSSGTFSDKNAGTAKAVTLTNTFGGVDAGNYSISDQASTSANITPKVLTVSGLAAASRTYDGTTNATATQWGGVNTGVGSEVLVLNHGTARFDTATVGSGKNVTATGYSLANGGSGASAGLASNYTLASTSAATTADITPAALRVVANAASKPADGVAYSGGNGVRYEGFVAGEDSSTLDGILRYGGSSQGAVGTGSYSITPQNLGSANYAITFVDGVLTIGEAVTSLPAPNPTTIPTPTPTPVLPNGDNGGGGGDGRGGAGGGLDWGGSDDGVTIAIRIGTETETGTGTGTGTGEKALGAAGAADGDAGSRFTESQQVNGCDLASNAVCVVLTRTASERYVGILNVSVPELELNGTSPLVVALPAEIFRLVQGKSVYLTLVDGTLLPDWASYLPESHTIAFSGASVSAFPLLLKLKAGDLSYVIVIQLRK